MRGAVALLAELELPEPLVLPLAGSPRGSSCTGGARRSRSCSGHEALRFHGPGDVRLEECRGRAGAGDVLVEVEVALTDGTDMKAFHRGHPVLLAELPSPFGDEFCGIDAATGRRVVAANSAPCRTARRAGGDRRPSASGCSRF